MSEHPGVSSRIFAMILSTLPTLPLEIKMFKGQDFCRRGTITAQGDWINPILVGVCLQ